MAKANLAPLLISAWVPAKVHKQTEIIALRSCCASPTAAMARNGATLAVSPLTGDRAVAARRGGKVLSVERSGHFSHVAQPELFAARVLEGRGG